MLFETQALDFILKSQVASPRVPPKDPADGRVRLFRALSLMFGETAAVYAFLRISRAMATIAVRTFGLLVVEFFDDFTQVENTVLADSAWATIEGSSNFRSSVSKGSIVFTGWGQGWAHHIKFSIWHVRPLRMGGVLGREEAFCLCYEVRFSGS